MAREKKQREGPAYAPDANPLKDAADRMLRNAIRDLIGGEFDRELVMALESRGWRCEPPKQTGGE
jgi:hypothetical protein